MDHRIKCMWAERLKGQPGQCRGVLRRRQHRDPWGVLCDLHAEETGGRWVICLREQPGDRARDGYSYLGSRFGLPAEVRRWAGIPKRLVWDLTNLFDTEELGQNNMASVSRVVEYVL